MRGELNLSGVMISRGTLCVTAAIWLAVAVGMGAEQPVTFDFEGAVGGEPRLPTPWKLLGHPSADRPAFQAVPDTVHGTVMRLHAKRNQADAIYRRADVDLNKFPLISFFWKVAKHPDGQIGTRRNDQAVKVQLDFGHRGFKRHVLSYVFDQKAKLHSWHDDSSFIAKNVALVLDTGNDKLNTWIGHSRNVFNDYRQVYKSAPPHVRNLSIFCDSNDSDSEAIGFCSPITFSRQPAAAADRRSR